MASGSSFFPTCASSESAIAPPAAASLFFAARTARAPYRLPAGPDVLQLAVTYSGNGATLTGSANDTRFNPASEPSQSIAGVNLFNARRGKPPFR